MVCSLDGAFPQNNFIHFIRNRRKNNNPKSLLFIPGVKSRSLHLNALLFSSLRSQRKRRILPEGLHKTKVRQFCLYPLPPASPPTSPQEICASENSCPLFQTRTNKKTVVSLQQEGFGLDVRVVRQVSRWRNEVRGEWQTSFYRL